jgi:hypothetical protein
MNRPTGPIQPDQPPAGGSRVTTTGTGIFLLTVGAIVRFALPAGSPHGLNLHVVGLILILAGVLQLVLPRFVHARAHPDRLRRWVRSRQSPVDAEQQASETPGFPDDSTLADGLLRYEEHLLP